MPLRCNLTFTRSSSWPRCFLLEVAKNSGPVCSVEMWPCDATGCVGGRYDGCRMVTGGVLLYILSALVPRLDGYVSFELCTATKIDNGPLSDQDFLQTYRVLFPIFALKRFWWKPMNDFVGGSQDVDGFFRNRRDDSTIENHKHSISSTVRRFRPGGVSTQLAWKIRGAFFSMKYFVAFPYMLM